MPTMTTSTNSASLHLYLERKLLSVLEPRLVLFPLGKKQSLPKGNGKQVKWLRYSKIASSTTALTEGTVPSEISVSTANVTATVSQYGQFAKVSDMLSMTAIDPVLKNLAERFGRAGAEAIEDLIVAELDSGAAIQRVNGRANNGAIVAGDLISHVELIEAMISQKVAYIGPHESGSYVVVLHPACEYDMLTATASGGFLDISKYTIPGRTQLLNGEIGRLYGMKVLVSDKMSSTADGSGGLDVRKNYVIGEEAFGVVDLDANVKMIIKPHGSAGANDPLDQFATVGYKIMGFAPKYLDASSKRVVQVRSSSSL